MLPKFCHILVRKRSSNPIAENAYLNVQELVNNLIKDFGSLPLEIQSRQYAIVENRHGRLQGVTQNRRNARSLCLATTNRFAHSDSTILLGFLTVWPIDWKKFVGRIRDVSCQFNLCVPFLGLARIGS